MKDGGRSLSPVGAAPIAIVGMSALFPGSSDLFGFWRDILQARDRIGDVPPTHWLVEDYYDPDPAAPDKTYCKRGGFLSPVAFDPMEFGIPPNALASTDSAQLLALLAAKRVLEDAARTRTKPVDPDRISVILGVASTTELVVSMGARLQAPVWRKAMREAGLPESEVGDICRRIADHYTPWQESSFPGLLGNVVAGRIANRLNLGGMNCVIDAACASSLAAVELAIKELESGDSDMVVTGGVDALNDIMMYMCFSKTPAFSPTGDCRPFADNADGTIIGEGVGLLALRRLADAEADGDAIYAVIRGLGASSDGRASSVYAPLPEGQAKALERAYVKAGYSPATVELVEAHGTGTKAGDAAELRGLNTVFAGQGKVRRSWCALGSVKSQIGHTKAAAGAAGLIKAVMALNEKALPPTIKVEKPNAALGHEAGPFYLSTRARPWVRGKAHPRRASVSSFGFGGSNFHVTLEEYGGSARRPLRLRALPDELVLLSANSKEELARAAGALGEGAGESLEAIAWRTAQSFEPKASARLALVASDEDELSRLAVRAADVIRSGTDQDLRDPDIHVGFGAGEKGGLAFLFPGQGSQYVGMGAAVALAFGAARAPWDEAADLAVFSDAPLHALAFPPPAFSEAERAAQERRLTEMANAQPAIAATSLALLRLLEILGLNPDVVAGHSFGEVSALAAGGAIPRGDLLGVARRRGELMTAAARDLEGAMLACSADGGTVTRALGKAAQGIVIANDNAPNQVVLAGTRSDIGVAEGALKAAGMIGHRLPVATAFHSPLVAPSCAPFHDYLKTLALSVPRIPVYGNTTASPYPKSPVVIARQLADQLARPVEFRAMIEKMYADGIRRFVEVGPGRVLTGLVGLCLGRRPHLAVALDDRRMSGLRALWRGVGSLAAAGLALDIPALMSEYAPPPAPKKVAPHAVMINGANVAKPYPPPGGAGALPPPNPERVPNYTPNEEVRSGIRVTEARIAAPVSPKDASALDRVQRETLEAHRQYQELMADSHRAFLELAARAIGELRGDFVLHDPPVLAAYKPAEQPASSLQRPLLPKGPEPVQPQPAPPAAAIDPASLVVEIVAEKTGYPSDMLDLDLEMEAGLGIDSIKQVEILSALQERLPSLPEIVPSELSNLRTLRDVVNRLGSVSVPVKSALRSDAHASVTSAAPPRDLSALVLEIVADKTGYPKDMLNLDQEMEASLGIDSIKQVEILSALQERLPELPEIAPAELATLRTLRDVVRRLDTNASASSNPVETPAERKSGVAGVAEPRGKADRALFLMTPRLVPAASADFDITRRRAGEVIYVTNEAPEIAAELVRILRDRNIAAELVTAVPARGSAVISLAGLGRELGTKSGLPVHLAALSSARAVAHHPQVEERLFVTVQGANGFGLAGDPGEGRWGAGLAGIAKTAGREWPGAGVKAIDVAEGARPEHIAQWIAAELLSGGAEAEVAFAADGSRYAVVCAPDGPAPNIGLPLPDGGVVIVSGGARGVTARAAEALAAEGGLRLALLGRTKMAQAQGELAESSNVIQLTKLLAARAEAQGEVIDLIAVKASACELAASNELRANLARLAERGIQAMYLAVDVRDATAVAAAVDRVRSHWGPISGIVHGAGILGDKRIADLSDTQFADVYETKVKGLQSLLDATRADPIRLVAVFSSIAARTGNAGQAAYAAGNDVLNKIAQHEARARGVGSVVRSYNWGPWDGGMVEPALKSHFQRQGVSLIAQTDGAEFFASDVAHARPVEIVAAASDRLPQRELKFFSRIDTMVFPELLDHQIHGRIVVPIAVVVERMLALALSARQRSDKQVLIRDLRILSGITLGLEEACRLCVRAVPMKGQSETLEITLSDETGRARYCAIAELCDVLPAKLSLPVAVGAAWPITVAEAYKSSLFHGPRLQAIESLERISADGGSARLLTEDRLGHPETERAIDIALIDGGLQLGLLWAKHQKGFVALPQRLGEVRVHRRPPRGEGLLCVFAARPRSASHIDFDFRFQTLAGECLAEIANAEFFAYQP